MKTSTKLLIAGALMVVSHSIPAWDTLSDTYSSGIHHDPHRVYDPYTPAMPQDSYVVPRVYGGGYTEVYPGGSITVNPTPFGGYSIHRNGFIPRSKW